jgi:hypothetical protein
MAKARTSLIYSLYNFVVVRDMRLKGWKPKGSAVLEVNHDTPLTWPIKWAAEKAAESKRPSYLRLMSHGYSGGMEFADQHITKETLALSAHSRENSPPLTCWPVPPQIWRREAAAPQTATTCASGWPKPRKVTSAHRGTRNGTA